MREIQLTKGKVALVDDEDYDRLSPFRWYAMRYGPGRWYARTASGPAMHREVLRLQRGDGIDVDHINHDGLDNRKRNLRPCTRRQNLHNMLPRRGKSSEFKGVSWQKRRSKWAAFIREPRLTSGPGKSVFLGRFDEEVEAALAYDRAALRLFGEFAYINYPEPHCGLEP